LQDADVATAVRFIRERAAESIDVEDVVEATIISRRLLEKKFAAILKRSPRQEILLSHLHQAKTLLLSTSLGAADIAVRSGFPSASKFSAVFRRETGMTPSEFRRLYGVHV
jgi:LacI family transcriptional regulator